MSATPNYSVAFHTKDNILRERYRKENRERNWFDEKWNWFFMESPEFTKELMEIYKQMNPYTPAAENVLPHVSDKYFMNCWPPYHKTFKLGYSILHRWPQLPNP